MATVSSYLNKLIFFSQGM